MTRRSVYTGNPPEERDDWLQRTRISLTPVAAPGVLGLIGFGGAWWPVAAHMAGWYGSPQGYTFLWQFGGLFGGILCLIAAVWSYRARNALGTGFFGVWGFWWLAFALLAALNATGVIPVPGGDIFPAFAFWFISMGIISMFCMIAALKVNLGFTAVCFCASTGSLMLAAGLFGGNVGLQHAGGADMFAGATIAIWTGCAIMVEEIWGRSFMWYGRTKMSRMPSTGPRYPLEYEHGMPGARAR